ncbi:MAG: response regulator [Kofleriaceae bacterium]|nr:response regulator [Kofleriaceae bacterium]
MVILEGGLIVFINAVAARLLGVGSIEAALGTAVTSYLPPADAQATVERIGRMMRTGEVMPANEYGVLAAPERTVEIKAMKWEWQGRPAVLAFARDVTERKALQQHLVRADRLAAVGTLAAGVAHEINNPLTYIQLSLQLIESALEKLPEMPEGVPDYIRDAQHGIERVAAITRSLRMFARADEAPPCPVDPVPVLDRALEIVGHDLRHRARLVRRIAETPWVIANGSRLEQVLVNLLLNSIQSLRGREDDTITVELCAAGTEHVALSITDTGSGISPAVRERIFDPFFTTKAVGEGMGLGLAVSKSIIDSIGGQLELTSTEGTGTTATVTLRAHEAPPKVVEPDPSIGEPRRVLVVDDEARVRELLGIVLGQFHDITVVDGGEAAIAAARDGQFDVIVCDVMMPGLSGVDVHKQLAAVVPGLERRIVFITGGTFVTDVAELVSATGNRVIQKPFDVEQILAAIAETARAAL